MTWKLLFFCHEIDPNSLDTILNTIGEYFNDNKDSFECLDYVIETSERKESQIKVERDLKKKSQRQYGRKGQTFEVFEDLFDPKNVVFLPRNRSQLIQYHSKYYSRVLYRQQG